MANGKRGRSQLGENELSKDQRRVRIEQMDWARLDQCLQLIVDDPDIVARMQRATFAVSLGPVFFVCSFSWLKRKTPR